MVGPVALVGVAREAVVAEVAPAPPGGVLAGARQVERGVRDRLLEQVEGPLVRVGRLEVGERGVWAGSGQPCSRQPRAKAVKTW